MANFIKVASLDQVKADQGLLVEANGQRLALFRSGENVFAVSDLCTHVGGPLSEGIVSGDEVMCPWHGARFNVRTGKALTPPARGDVACFPVRVTGQDIEVELP